MTDDKAPWFPCNPGKLLGALAAMKSAQGYVYVIVLLRIYETGGPCRDTIDALANRTKLNRKAVGDALDALVSEGKLIRTETGIMNPVAAKVLVEVNDRREKRKQVGQKGGLKSAEKRQSKQQKAPTKATPPVKQASTQIQLQEQEKKPPIPLAGDTAPKGAAPSKRKRLMKPKVPKAGKPQLPLPDRWRLSERALKFAKERGFEGARALDLATRFESYHRSKGSTSADWECSWQTWVMNDIKFTERKNGEDLNGKTRQSGGERLTHSVLAAQLRASIASRQH